MSLPSEVPTIQAPPPQPDYWTRPEAAAVARLKSAKHLDKLIRDARAKGRPVPPKLKLNKKITLFPRVGFLEWINAHQVAGDLLLPSDDAEGHESQWCITGTDEIAEVAKGGGVMRMTTPERRPEQIAEIRLGPSLV